MSHPGRRRGSVSVEFALVAPVVLMILYGICDYSWYMMSLFTVRVAVQDGVRDGAVVATVDGPCTVAVASVRQHLDEGGLDGTSAVVNCGMDTFAYGNAIWVTATLDYDALAGLVPMPDLLQTEVSAFFEGDIML
jgi:Flp pilus assembly protein TadG